MLQSANLEAQTEELDFTDNEVGVDVANAIGQGLQTSHTLTRLYLSGNGIGDRYEPLCVLFLLPISRDSTCIGG